MPPLSGPILLAVILCMMPGCAAQEAPLTRPVRIDAQTYDQTYQQTVVVLRDYGFRVARQDHRFGRITSFPLAVPNNIEVWSPLRGEGEVGDMAGVDQLRRVVTVTWKPGPVTLNPEQEQRMLAQAAEQSPADAQAAPAQVPFELIKPTSYDFDVEVELQRRQVPVRRLSGTAGRRPFSDLKAVPYELREKDVPATYWEPVGRDEAFEQKLLEAIMRRSAPESS